MYMQSLYVSYAAQAVIYAATCDWSADQRKRKDGSPLQPAEDLRYYARGVFTWPQVRGLRLDAAAVCCVVA
jgi:hypothetical protein